MKEVTYMFEALPGAVFCIGWHWLKVIKPIGPLNLRVFTSNERHHDLDTSTTTNAFPHVWVGLTLRSPSIAIKFIVPTGVPILSRES